MTNRRAAALAGRRIDAAGADPERFPLRNAELVRERLRAALHNGDIGTLISSAACGADLLALDEAARLGIRRRVVLPFAPTGFRMTSVTDRPGAWGELYDRVTAEIKAAGDLMVMDADLDSPDAYELATQAIITEALRLSSVSGDPTTPLALVVWEGAARGLDDATESFRRQAAKHDFEVRTILTL